MSKKILFVDDETLVLNSLERASLEWDYQTFFTNSGIEALSILEKEEIDIIVSDIRMEPMDGYTLLSKVRSTMPSIARVVLSAYSDKEEMLRCIIDGVATVYFTKPWDNDQLKERIDRILYLQNELKSSSLLASLCQPDTLPTPPKQYQKIVSMIRNECSATELASEIEKDPAWASRVLQTVNSAFYGVSINTIRHALVYLGTDTLRSIVLVAELINNYKGSEKVLSTIWNHVQTRLTIATQLHQRLFNKRLNETTVSQVLLCDIGRLFLASTDSNRSEQFLHSVKNNSFDQLDRCQISAFGFSLQKLSAQLLEYWNLPGTITESSLFLRKPEEAKINSPAIMAIISIADLCAWCRIEKMVFTSPSPDILQLVPLTAELIEAEIITLEPSDAVRL